MDTTRLWSIEQTADYLGISSSTVRRMLQAGKIVGRKVGAQWRFDPDEIRRSRASKAFSPTQTVQGQSSGSNGAVLLPRWATGVISKWRRFVQDQLASHLPDQVVVTDRRGSKIWELFGLEEYVWGENLWHSAAVRAMGIGDRRRLFSRRKVLIFDEILQRGRELLNQRQLVEEADGTPIVVACVRKRSLAERGEVVADGVLICEDLHDNDFADRAALVSRLTASFRPPLDVGHLVIRGMISQDSMVTELLERMAQWGLPFVVWHPADDESTEGEARSGGIDTLSVTLDRPQFFETVSLPQLAGFKVDWNGPCKIRFYINLASRSCDCSFIIYPSLKGSETEWVNAANDRIEELGLPKRIVPSDLDDAMIRRIYTTICTELTCQLLSDFIRSGAATAIGINLEHAQGWLEEGQFKATFGLVLGPRVLRQTREVLRDVGQMEIGGWTPKLPPPLFLRDIHKEADLSHSSFDCRRALVSLVPRQTFNPGSGIPQCIQNAELFHQLREYAQVTIGTVIDYEIDRGTTKPYIDIKRTPGGTAIDVVRGFVRGEFGPYYEWEGEEPTHDDAQIQLALGLGPTVIDEFLKASKQKSVTGSQFAKLFANLQHDWSPKFGPLFLGWRPYKYGPIPIVPVPTATGEFMRYELFLEQQKCIARVEEKHGSRIWHQYAPPGESPVPWRDLYRRRTDGATRAFIAGLVRVYAAIDAMQTTRPRAPRSEDVGQREDSLVVLGSARNKIIAYRSAWFEIHDWINKGKLLFALIKAHADTREQQTKPVLRSQLEDFAQPARLLHEKLEMYRQLPQLRHQIEALQEEHPHVAVILESMDEQPEFETVSPYPLGNLEWASKIARSFSSFTRQVLTACGLDVDSRRPEAKRDAAGNPIDATYFLRELISAGPEIDTIRAALELSAAESAGGRLTERIADILSKTFDLISQLFAKPGMLPDPRPEYESRREHNSRMDGLIARLKELALAEPYAVALADIRNLGNLPGIGEILGISRNDAMSGFLKWLANAAKIVEKKISEVRISPVSTDAVLIVGHPTTVIHASRALIQETTVRLAEIDHNQLAPFGLLRVGIALVDGKRGEHFSAVQPGFIAHRICERAGRPLGAISITGAVFELLSTESKEGFELSDENSPQGFIWICPWRNANANR